MNVLDRDEALEHAAARRPPAASRCDARARIRSASSSVVPSRAVIEPVLRHRLVQRPVEVALELQIAIRDDADEPFVVVDDRHARDAKTVHERRRFTHRIARAAA